MHTIAPGAAIDWAARRFLIPARPRRGNRRATAAQARIGGLAAWSWGDGPTVLLVHGWEDDHIAFAAWIEPLLARNFRVVTFDLPAHGASRGRQSTLPQAIDAIRTIARAIGPLQAIVGHSYGGAAAALALTEGVAARRAVLLAAPSTPRYFAQGLATRLGLNPAQQSAFLTRVQQRVGMTFERLTLAARPAPTQPALILHSNDDRVVPLSHSRANAAAWHGATLRVLQRLGHRRLLRDPAVIADAIDFIAADSGETQTARNEALFWFDDLPSAASTRRLALQAATETLRAWRQRRFARRELARIDARTLADAGISGGAVDYEIGQPFWRPLNPLR